MLILVFGMYYRRYRDKELVTAAALFNIFVLAVLTVLSSVEFSVAAGFGLFASQKDAMRRCPTRSIPTGIDRNTRLA